MSALTASHLGLERGRRWTLRNVSMRLEPGMAVALVGPNGSGKSTLLRCLAGLWTPTEGEVHLEDKDLRGMRRSEIARNISYVPQETHLEFDFTVREMILMGRFSHRGRFDRETPEDRSVAADALRRADIAHWADRLVTQLSGGERQRVLIARSLATQSQILLLDEPTANLDVDHSLDILELCRELANGGRTVAIATHDLNAVCRFVDSVALLDKGELIGYGTPDAVLTAENMRKAFRVNSEVLVGSGGASALLFHRLHSSATDTEVRP